MGTIRFVLRNDKPGKDNLCPIQLIYQISGSRKYFNTGLKLNPENWNSIIQQAFFLDRKTIKQLAKDNKLETPDYLIPTEMEVNKINASLIALRQEIIEIENHYLFTNKIEVGSPGLVTKTLTDRRSLTKPTKNHLYNVFDFIEKYILDNKASREPGSMSVYKALKNHLQRFEKDKKTKVTFDLIDYSFFLDFQNFLIITKTNTAPSGLSNSTIAKQLSTLKTFLNYARMQGVVISDGYKDFKIKKESLEVIALTNEEFELLANMDLSKNNKLDQVRDVFIYSCTTGFRYSDLKQLKREHIKNEHIKLTVTKTKQKLVVPLNPYSYAIINKYAKMQRPLPIISNQKYNLYIKELCQLAELNDPIQIVRFRGSKREENTYPKWELISAHTGRKTFATLSLEKGMSAEEVMKIGGWKSYASFARYVNITEKRTKVVMGKAWGEISHLKVAN